MVGRQDELQIESRHLIRQIDHRQLEIGQLERYRLQVLECQHHLEQRVSCLGPLYDEFVHHLFEWHVGVFECVQIGLFDPAEQVGKGFIEIDLGPQHQGIDEHADHVVECGYAAPGDRCSDRNVGGTTQPGEQDRQGAMDHHEQ